MSADQEAAKAMAPLVGALPDEVAAMQTLTANLHLLMASFYRPDPQGRFKVIIESKAFPSDHVSSIFSLSSGSPCDCHIEVVDSSNGKGGVFYV